MRREWPILHIKLQLLKYSRNRSHNVALFCVTFKMVEYRWCKQGCNYETFIVHTVLVTTKLERRKSLVNVLSRLWCFSFDKHTSICTVLVDLKLSSATSSLYKERGTGTIWACSQNPLKHNTQHMALRHAEQLNKYLTPIPAYTDRHPHEMISQLRVLILCCNFLKTCLTCS